VLRILSPTLLAAQQSASIAPDLEAKVYPTIAGVRRLVWSRVYGGTEPAREHSAWHSGEYLGRCRSVSGGNFQHQVLLRPDASSDWSTWTDGGVQFNAIDASSLGSLVMIVGVTPSGQLRQASSASNGRNWTGFTTWT